MKLLIASVCLTVAGTAGVLAASDRTSVTITGCVEKGDAPDTYVLMNVTEVSPRVQNPAKDIYWLTSTKGLPEQVGHRIQVTGLVSADDDIDKTGKIKVKTAANGDTKIAVETEGKKAQFKVDAPDGAVANETKIEVKKPVRTLHVRSIRMVAPSCS